MMLKKSMAKVDEKREYGVSETEKGSQCVFMVSQ